MEAQAAAPAMDTAADTAPAESAPAPEAKDEVAAATPDDAGRRNPKGDKYKEEVNTLLNAYEAKQARLSAERREAAARAPKPELEGLREGESWDDIYSRQTPEAQRAMAEMRKAFTRKSQDLAAEKRKIEAQNRALMESGIVDQLAAEAGKVPDDFDPFNPDHLMQVIESKVAARLKQVLEPMHKQHQQHESRARYENFKAEHPDLVNDSAIKQGVYAALQKDPSLKLEAAYWMVKGKALAKQQRESADRAEVRRRAHQRAAQVTSRGGRPGKQVLTAEMADGNAWDIYNRLLKARGQ
jgi:hypothetical protein